MKDFKNFEGSKKPDTEDKKQNPTGTPESVNATVELAKAIAKAFNGKSEGDVLRTVLAQAEEGKRNGTLTNADLDNFYNALYPLLDGFKRQKLKMIINKLKAL
ncbi:MAG: hypothetical protein J6B04_05360 [Clostridia bacterium]|nr:hypothetical protein [Clostridia bacterium]